MASEAALSLDPTRRLLVTGSAVLATMMVAVDTTIANVALPHIQAGMSASSEQVVWVLTSYLIASAIAIPLSGWLASRFGRKFVMVGSVLGFTLASLACGASQNLSELVIARFIQGACGAGLGPLSQAMLFDIYPPEKQGQAMAAFGMGTMFGPLIGPTLGGWLTDTFSWRWCFLINLPIGIAAGLGLFVFMRVRRSRPAESFDLFGFTAVSLFLGSLQLMLDRGQQLDWFRSTEICIEAAVMALAGWTTFVHTMTSPHGFIQPTLLRDRNFMIGCLIAGTIGVVAMAAVPLMTIMMQQLLGYSALETGLVTFPRGIGSLISMVIVGRLIAFIDKRLLLTCGLTLTAIGLSMLAQLPLTTGQGSVEWAGFFQGLGIGLSFVPLSVMVFATMPPNLRNEGSAIYALTRNMGASLGISWLQALTIQTGARAQSRLVETVSPDNPAMNFAMPGVDLGVTRDVALLYGEVQRQAQMIAYTHTYWMLCLLALGMIPIVALLRNPANPGELGHLALLE